jgi:hypothetical protein
MSIHFHEIEDCKLISYYYYLDQVSNNGLRELNGFKIRNILSVTFNTKIRNLVLRDLFNENGRFLTDETKDNLFRFLSTDELDDLKNLLYSYLDYQIESSWLDYVCEVLTESGLNTIIVSSHVLGNYGILNELKALFPHKRFLDWHNINDTTPALFIDYNQSWKKRNIFNYKHNNSKFIFLKHFFENVYKRRIYNDEKQIFEILNVPLRKQLFGDEILAGMKANLDSLKPSESFNEWDLLHDSDDRNSNNPQEEIIIQYNLDRSNRYRTTASFLLYKEKKYFIASAKELVTNSSRFENIFEFSHLETIIGELDLNELNKAIQKDESINLVIQPLWNKFNLNEENGSLWKQLLKKKIQENGLLSVYSEIERMAALKNFVSINTFKNTYCNPNSPSVIPREKRIFKAICKYLELPLEYRLAIQRERILIGGHSQELHVKLKAFIEAIVELGVLDIHKNDDKLLETLNGVIEKIEERVDIEYFGFNRDSLLYACIGLCYEITNKIRLKPIVKIEHIIPNEF